MCQNDRFKTTYFSKTSIFCKITYKKTFLYFVKDHFPLFIVWFWWFGALFLNFIFYICIYFWLILSRRAALYVNTCVLSSCCIFSTTFMKWVSFSTVPECVVVFAGFEFSRPPRATRTPLLLLLLLVLWMLFPPPVHFLF